MSKINFVLLALVTLSALYVTDLRMEVKRQTHFFAKAQEEEIRLNQDKAALLYERSKLTDVQLVEQAAKSIHMHEPSEKEMVQPKF